MSAGGGSDTIHREWSYNRDNWREEKEENFGRHGGDIWCEKKKCERYFGENVKEREEKDIGNVVMFWVSCWRLRRRSSACRRPCSLICLSDKLVDSVDCNGLCCEGLHLSLLYKVGRWWRKGSQKLDKTLEWMYLMVTPRYTIKKLDLIKERKI